MRSHSMSALSTSATIRNAFEWTGATMALAAVVRKASATEAALPVLSCPPAPPPELLHSDLPDLNFPILPRAAGGAYWEAMPHTDEITYDEACRLIRRAGRRPAEFLEQHPAHWSDGAILVCSGRAIADWLRTAPNTQNGKPEFLTAPARSSACMWSC